MTPPKVAATSKISINRPIKTFLLRFFAMVKIMLMILFLNDSGVSNSSY